MKYSNPRMNATIEDWPYGQYRTTAKFSIETNGNKQRAVRITTDPKTGRETAPKKLTYAQKARIVDGDDGRTYILEWSGFHISIMKGDMKFQHEVIFEKDERFNEVKALFEEVKP